MPKAKQFSITVENRPGTLAHVAKVLGDAKVSILAFATGTSGAEGYVQVIVDNANKAKKALEDARFSYAEADVLHVELGNTPGALGQYAGKLASKDINITFGYATTVKGSRKASVVLMVSDVEKAVRMR
jgi:hypothetical protein